MKLRGLYAIVDTQTLARAELDPIAFTKDVLTAKPAALQLRAKNENSDRTLSLAREMLHLCREARVPFVLNDRIDLAALAECDLVHLGQDDRREEDASTSKIAFGLSTHTPKQLADALERRPAYVAFGPVFETSSKENPDPIVGLEGLARARTIVDDSDARDTPLVAIGGISLENAANIAEFADAGAVIGALIGADVRARAKALHEKLGGAR